MAIAGRPADVKDVFELIKERGIRYVDFRILDLLGQWQHVTAPIGWVDEDTFRRGVPFDGSSVRGFQTIEVSDMVMLPDPTTAFVDSFSEVPTLVVACDVYTPNLEERYTRDPRYVAQKAESYLRSSGTADAAFFGPELEFFIFDEVRFGLDQHQAFYFIDSVEGIWNAGKPGADGYAVRNKLGYFPVLPTDKYGDLRSQMTDELERVGLRVERHHHEVATAGQGEINFGPDTLVRTADNVMKYKYVLRGVAQRNGKTVTFMPKPLFGDNGSGMHTHQSLAKNGHNLFWQEGAYGNLSQTALHYLGGILYHAPALCALTNPTTNSYKRLVPGYEAPVNLVFSKANRSAAVRIPIGVSNPRTARIEFRTPDPTANPYLAFAAMLMAGLDGIRRRLDPVAMGYGPLDRNIYELGPEERAEIRSVPGSLEDALDALEQDREFLLEGGVFTPDLLETWLQLKRAEIDSVRVRPHPVEFALFFDL